MLRLYEIDLCKDVCKKDNLLISIHEQMPSHNDMSKGRLYELDEVNFKTYEKRETEVFETQFDESAKGTSYRTKNNAVILQGDSTCLPIPLKEYKDKMKSSLTYSIKALFLEDKSALMMDKFTDGLQIEDLSLDLDSDQAKDGSLIQKYVNEFARTEDVRITVRMDDRAWAAKNITWIGGFISKWQGIDPLTIQKFILGIRPLNRFQLEINDWFVGGEQHTWSPVINEKLISELCKKHTHILIMNQLSSSQPDVLWSLFEMQRRLPKMWRSLELKVSFKQLKSAVSNVASVRIEGREMCYDPHSNVRYIQKAYNIDCFFFDDSAVFVGSSLGSLGTPLHRKLFELRMECNIDLNDHWTTNVARRSDD